MLLATQDRRSAPQQRDFPHLLKSVLLIGAALGTLILLIWSITSTWQYVCCINSQLEDQSFSLLNDTASLVVAVGLWITAVVGLWLRKYRLSLPWTFLLACFLGSGVVSSSTTAVLTLDPDNRLLYVQAAWLAPLIVHHHLALVQSPFRRITRMLLGIIYGLAVIWSFWIVGSLLSAIPVIAGSVGWRTDINWTFVSSIVLVICLLAWEHHQNTSPTIRRRIRLVLLGTALAFTPLVILIIVGTLGLPLFLRYQLTFPLLLLSPLFYILAVSDLWTVRIDHVLNRATTYYVLGLIVVSSYLLIDGVFSFFIAKPPWEWLIVNAFASTVVLLFAIGVQQKLRRAMNWLWYGKSISYNKVISKLAEELALTLDQKRLKHLLVEKLPSTLGVEACGLYLQKENTLSLVGFRGYAPNDAWHILPIDGLLVRTLANQATPISQASLRQLLVAKHVSLVEQELVACPAIAYWLPLITNNAIQGIVLVGHRPHGDFFTAEDERILHTLAHQAGIAAHNVQLAEEITLNQQALQQAHHQLITGYERERRRLAQSLHDESVQDLLAVSYQLAAIQNKPEQTSQGLASARREVLHVAQRLRQQISELRPPGLDDFGLAASISMYIARLQNTMPVHSGKIVSNIDAAIPPVPEPVAICLFRVAQEALRNAVKHAQARQITVRLYCQNNTILLQIHDDGCGFVVAASLSIFAEDQHFGLVGIAEQVEWVNGRLFIESLPDRGTTLRVSVPLQKEENERG